MKVLFSKTQRPYLGPELRPHFLLQELGVKGSALTAFIGPCSVKTEHMVDWEDRLVNDRIEARLMVHFLGEFFGMTLHEGVLLQRLLISMMAQSLNLTVSPLSQAVQRKGDDLFWKERKLSVSIVTASPVSVLLHAGINLDPSGAPVAAVGLYELGLTHEEVVENWIPGMLGSFLEEWESMNWACAKVRPVI